MLEMLLDKKLLFVLMGMLTGLGVADKCIVSMTMKRMIEAAGSMSKSNHPLMRLVRAKFEHACMISDTVENVGVFVDKYLYEYKVCGLRLHSLRRLEKMCSGLLIVTGLAGAGITCQVYGMGDEALRMGAAGCGLGILVWLFHLTTDENYCMEMAKNYMVDYLENVCLRKYEKMNQKERTVRVNIENGPAEEEIGPAEEEIQKNKIQKDEIQKDEIQRDEVQETEAGTEETPAPVPDHSVVHMQREDRRRERTQNTAKNLAKASAGLAGMDGSKSPEAEEQKDAPKELAKDEMIRQILREFMA
ncbi:hypothetical protein DW265_14000 [Dorea longicatena]|uniref:Uncharacterized protein n=1 Tax=Dorea longicatena TaxID=88431 RepID=A0A414SNR5_9FIRM|nr:hypothetical protein [Dorea longicatena]RHG21710.1 hypothetical protein DW265_14000 [Dorea longicatena]